mmetsp:Transcript_53113/g.164597  ORF Transcript_53113/g.164597 Transcript_53113/m.164597 type:complete len:203 (+) Transcript_53113:560-1168(+)
MSFCFVRPVGSEVSFAGETNGQSLQYFMYLVSVCFFITTTRVEPQPSHQRSSSSSVSLNQMSASRYGSGSFILAIRRRRSSMLSSSSSYWSTKRPSSSVFSLKNSHCVMYFGQSIRMYKTYLSTFRRTFFTSFTSISQYDSPTFSHLPSSKSSLISVSPSTETVRCFIVKSARMFFASASFRKGNSKNTASRRYPSSSSSRP